MNKDITFKTLLNIFQACEEESAIAKKDAEKMITCPPFMKLHTGRRLEKNWKNGVWILGQ